MVFSSRQMGVDISCPIPNRLGMHIKSEVILRWEYPFWGKAEMLARKQQIQWSSNESPTNQSYGRISVTTTLLFSGHLILYRLDKRCAGLDPGASFHPFSLAIFNFYPLVFHPYPFHNYPFYPGLRRNLRNKFQK